MSSDDEIKKLFIMEYMDKMPNTLSTKKEIDEYYKNGWKKIKEKIREEKKEGPKKPVIKVNLDENGDEIEVIKKPLNAYNLFVKEQRPKVEEEFPELSNGERFSKIKEMWKKHKEDKKKEAS
jgi:hypothetical protein